MWIDSLENILVFVGWMFLCVIVLNPIIICLYKVEKFKIKFNLSKESTIKSVILWTIYTLMVIFLVFFCRKRRILQKIIFYKSLKSGK